VSDRDLPRTFGPYEIVRRIAGGGAAEVFLARARSVAGFEKHVALKMVHARNSRDPEATRRLIEEARLTSRLRHRNIVQVIDLGEVEGRHYIAMEYVDGLDLGRLLDRLKSTGALPSPLVAAFITREVCEGLEHAHRARSADDQPLRIVHRDVSPPNVLVSYDGEVKLADFGLARASDRPSSTQAGVIKGKYSYLSPEQVRGLAVDARSDVFAAAAVLYELAVGLGPFPDAPLPILLERVSRALIEDPARLRPDLPPAFVAIIRRGLQADPAQRYQSARAFSEALSEFIFAHGTPPEAELVRLIERVAETRQHAMEPLAPNLPMQLSDEVTRIEPIANIRSRFVSGTRDASPFIAPPASLSDFFDDPVADDPPAPTVPPGAVDAEGDLEFDIPASTAPPVLLFAQPVAPTPPTPPVEASPSMEAPLDPVSARYTPLTAPPQSGHARRWMALAVGALALLTAAWYLR
jgi:serine/threonine protein kinase